MHYINVLTAMKNAYVLLSALTWQNHRASLTLQLTLEQCGGKGCRPLCTVKNLCETLGSRTPQQIQKSSDVQIPYIKWCRSVHTVRFRNPWTPNLRSKTVQVIYGKYPCISGSVQFKPMLFKGQLYLHLCYHNCS